MDLRSSPALLPCAALLAAGALALGMARSSIPLAVALVGCGAAAGGAAGRLVAASGVGLLAVWVQGWGAAPPAPEPASARPVTLVGSPIGHWQRGDGAWSAVVRSERYRQGPRVELWRREVVVSVPGERPPAASRLRLRGYLRRTAGLVNEPALPPGRRRLWVKSGVFLEAEEGRLGAAWSAALARLRTGAERALADAEGAVPSRGLILGRALVLGDGFSVPPDWKRGLRRAGLAHLTALSGLHLGLLAAAALAAGVRLPRRLRLAPVLAVSVLYLALAGPRPGLLRAGAMLGLACAALALGRPPRTANLLGCAALGLVLLDASRLRDLGFRLSASATAGIVLLSPLLARNWGSLPPWLGRPLAATVGAQLGSLPWALPAFHLVTPLAPLWNLAAIPWTALTLTACFCWTALAAAAPQAGAVLLPVLDLLAWPYEAVSRLRPGLFLPLPLSVDGAAALILASGLAAVLLRPRAALAVALAVLVAGGAGAALAALLAGPPAGGSGAPLELRLIDVGQGDAVLLRDGPAAVLVDGGGWRHGDIGGRVLLPVLARAGIARLRALVLTHPDLDHCGGLLDLASYLPVEQVWTAPGWPPSDCATGLLTLPVRRIRPLWAGEGETLGRWRIETLHPPAGTRRSGNDRSVVLLARAAGTRVLLTGDLEAAGERRLLARLPHRLRAEVLKVAHHGSKTSTSAAFRAAVDPSLALISAGAGNRYGHPAEPVLRRLAAGGVPTLRTDRSGMVVLALHPGGGRRVRLSAPGPAGR